MSDLWCYLGRGWVVPYLWLSSLFYIIRTSNQHCESCSYKQTFRPVVLILLLWVYWKKVNILNFITLFFQSAAAADVHGAVAAHGEGGAGHGAGKQHEHKGHEYHVFHVEFERVEIPFIIALWIFVSSLAKIGKNYCCNPFFCSWSTNPPLM